MKRKSLLELAAMLLTVLFFVSAFPARVSKAYGEEGTKEVDGYTFTYDSELGLYKTEVTNVYNNVFTYYLIDQGLVDKFGGTLPYYTKQEENMSITRRFYLGEDITVTKGLVAPYHLAMQIDTQGRKITYDPSDISEVMWDGKTNAPASISFQTSDDFIYKPANNGKIYSPNGASLFLIGSEGYSSGGASLRDVDLQGGYGINYTDIRNRAVTVTGNGCLSVYFGERGCVISGFSAEEGGAIYVEGGKFAVDSGGYTYGASVTLEKALITGCYAKEGGAVYLNGQMEIKGEYDYGNESSEFIYGIKNNKAENYGGGIYVAGPYAQLSTGGGTAITGNMCKDGFGGGVYIDPEADAVYNKLLIKGCTKIVDNSDFINGVANDVYIDYKGGSRDCIFVYDMRDLFGCSEVGITGTGFSSGDVIVRGDFTYDSELSDFKNTFFLENIDYKLLDPRKIPNSNYSDITIVKGDGTTAAALKGYSLIMDGTAIGIKFHVYMPENEDLGSSTNNIWTAKVSAASEPGLCVKGINEKTLKLDSYERDGDKVTFTYCVDSTDMTVPLKFELYKAGQTEPVDTMTGFTVRDYIDAVCKDYKKYGRYSANCAVTLAMYGAASQKYFGFRKDDLADKNLTESLKQEAAFKEYELDTLQYYYDPQSANMPFSINDGEHISFYGWTMSFTGKPSVKYYFRVKDPADADKVTFDLSHYYNADQVKITKLSDYYYCIKFSGLSMYDTSSTIKISAFYNGAETPEIEFFTKPINYVFWIKNDQGGYYSSEAHELAEAFILYFKRYYG